MNDLTQSRLASVLTVLVGGWLMLSPVFISITGGALVSLMVVGGIFVVAGVVQYFWESTLPSWLTAMTAIYLFVSAIGFQVSDAAMWNQVVAAIVTFVLATWDGVEMMEVRRLHHGTI